MRYLCSTLILISVFFSNTLFANTQLIIEPEQGRAPLLQAIQQAQSSIDIVMYGFTDLAFADALIQAQNNHKNVRVLLQHRPYRTESENDASIRYLQSAHIPMVWPDGDYQLTHQKTFLLDQNKAIVMTCNLTHSTFKNVRNFALIITDPSMLAEIRDVFEHDWKHEHAQTHVADLVWSPDNSRAKLLAFIKSAKSNIHIYADGLSDYQIIGALAQAARKGIAVDILTNQNNAASEKKLNYLRKSGVIIHYDKHLHIHAKVILIDHTSALLGSINFTRASINNNRELSVITRDPSVVQTLNQIFDQDSSETTTPQHPSSSPNLMTIPKPLQKFIKQSIRELSLLQDPPHKPAHKKHLKNNIFINE